MLASKDGKQGQLAGFKKLHIRKRIFAQLNSVQFDSVQNV